jgi:hypothetical protein
MGRIPAATPKSNESQSLGFITFMNPSDSTNCINSKDFSIMFNNKSIIFPWIFDPVNSN